MKNRGTTYRFSLGGIGGIAFLAAALFIFRCTENDPVRLEPGQRPGAVPWIWVKTGLVDTSKNPDSIGMRPEEYVRILNRAGFIVSWGSSKGAAYYEVRVSKSAVTNRNWSRAYIAAKVYGAGDTISTVIDRIQPAISGKKCTGCKACVGACPRRAITIYKGKAVIDPDSCIGCSMCYDKCTYTAVSDENLTKYYFFAVRAFSRDGVPAEEVTCTGTSYKSRYTNMAEKEPDIIWCGRCGENCYILNPGAGKGKNIDFGACPVDAVYYDDGGMIYIDQSKCIACGLCVGQCGFNNGKWSVRREIISSPWK